MSGIEILDHLIWAALGLFFVGLAVGIGIGIELIHRLQQRVEDAKNGRNG